MNSECTRNQDVTIDAKGRIEITPLDEPSTLRTADGAPRTPVIYEGEMVVLKVAVSGAAPVIYQP